MTEVKVLLPSVMSACCIDSSITNLAGLEWLPVSQVPAPICRLVGG